MHRTAIIGVSGPRAHGHATAYRTIKNGRVVAVSSRQEGAAERFLHEAEVRATPYRDHLTMLEAERPDVVHLNTPPDARLELLRDCERYGVRGVIVEKPLGIDGKDARAMRAFAATTSLKVVVNHQLHFHPRRQALMRLLTEGLLGTVRLIDASAGDNLAYQGTHTIQALLAFAAEEPRQVFATVSGSDGLAENSKRHYAPDACVAQVTFASGLEGIIRCGTNAPRTPSPQATRKFHHKRIAVHGSRGYLTWSMWGWETFVEGRYETGTHDYYVEDALGQAGLVTALFDWLDGRAASHPLCLDRSLSEFELLLALYESATDRVPIALPHSPRADILDDLRKALR